MIPKYFNATNKRVILLFSVLFLSIFIGFGFAAVRFLHQFVITDFKNESHFISNLLVKSFNNTLDQGKYLLGSVELSPAVKKYYRHPTQKGHQFLEQEIVSKMSSFKEAAQFRILSPSGMEIVRINRDYTDKRVTVVPESQLQDKSDRYYHKAILKLKGDQFYFSDLDLNFEHQVIMVPYEPTIRIGQKIFVNGRFVAYAILNINLSQFIQNLRDVSEMRYVVVDRHGQILIGPTPAKSWHKQLKQRLNFAQVLRDGNGAINLSSEKATRNYRVTPLFSSSSQQKLFLVAEKPEGLIKQVPFHVLVELLAIFGLLLTFVAFFIWYLALRVSRWIGEFEMRSRMLDQVSDSVYVYSQQGRFIYANQQAWKGHGFTEQEFMKLDVVELNPEKTPGKIQETFSRLAHVPNLVFRGEHLTQHGETLPVEISASLFEVNEQRVVLSVARDIREQLKHEQALVNLERRYRQLMDESPVGIVEMTRTCEFTYANRVFLELFDVDNVQKLNQPTLQRLKQVMERFVGLVSDQQIVQDFECDLVFEDAPLLPRYYRMNGVLRNDKIVATCVDVSDQRDQVLLKKLWTQLVDQIEELIMVTNAKGEVTYVNRAFMELTGYGEKDILGQKPSLLKSGQHDKAFYEAVWQNLLSGQSVRDVFVNRKANGDIFYEDKLITPIFDENGKVSAFVSNSRVVTEQVQHVKALQHQAEHDSLTGLYNRHSFNSHLEAMLADYERLDRPFCIVFFDVDHFKKVNDTYGHDIGDEVLKQVAQIVEAHSRRTDVFARWGGEEFILLLCDTELKQAERIAELLRQAIESSHSVDRPDVTASFGVTQVKPDDTLESIEHRADELMYQAKKKGRNQVCAN